MIKGKRVEFEELLKFASVRKIRGEQKLNYGYLVLFEDGTAVSIDAFDLGFPACKIYEDYAQKMEKHLQMLEQARKVAALTGQEFVEPTNHPCDEL